MIFYIFSKSLVAFHSAPKSYKKIQHFWDKTTNKQAQACTHIKRFIIALLGSSIMNISVST